VSVENLEIALLVLPWPRQVELLDRLWEIEMMVLDGRIVAVRPPVQPPPPKICGSCGGLINSGSNSGGVPCSSCDRARR
jgi:hypothetical protein